MHSVALLSKSDHKLFDQFCPKVVKCCLKRGQLRVMQAPTTIKSRSKFRGSLIRRHWRQMSQCFWAGGAFSRTTHERIQQLILGPILSKSGKLIHDVRPVTRDAGTDTAEATFTGPTKTYTKALVTADPVVQCRGRVRWHFSANLTIDFRTDLVQRWSIDP